MTMHIVQHMMLGVGNNVDGWELSDSERR